MNKYSIHVTFENLGFYKEIETENLESANLLAIELGEKEFGLNLDSIVYEVSDITDNGIIAMEDLNG
jgi:hypothetical protein